MIHTKCEVLHASCGYNRSCSCFHGALVRWCSIRLGSLLSRGVTGKTFLFHCDYTHRIDILSRFSVAKTTLVSVSVFLLTLKQLIIHLTTIPTIILTSFLTSSTLLTITFTTNQPHNRFSIFVFTTFKLLMRLKLLLT